MSLLSEIRNGSKASIQIAEARARQIVQPTNTGHLVTTHGTGHQSVSSTTHSAGQRSAAKTVQGPHHQRARSVI